MSQYIGGEKWVIAKCSTPGCTADVHTPPGEVAWCAACRFIQGRLNDARAGDVDALVNTMYERNRARREARRKERESQA